VIDCHVVHEQLRALGQVNDSCPVCGGRVIIDIGPSRVHTVRPIHPVIRVLTGAPPAQGLDTLGAANVEVCVDTVGQLDVLCSITIENGTPATPASQILFYGGPGRTLVQVPVTFVTGLNPVTFNGIPNRTFLRVANTPNVADVVTISITPLPSGLDP
jgi:hypothetical protein